jgi:ribonuclease HII
MLENFVEFKNNYPIESVCGVDEAGRGPLAGPVTAAAVILKTLNFSICPNDSKKLVPKQRELLFKEIVQNALCFKVSVIDPQEIIKTNILRASLEAMRRSVKGLKFEPAVILVDGNQKIPGIENQKTLVRGDSLSVSIACASILAKVVRDKIMIRYDKLFPEYDFKSHKGYGTKKHLELIKKYGPCPIHRTTFRGVLQNKTSKQMEFINV